MTPDQPYSIAVAVVGAILALLLPARYAICPLALAIAFYPSAVLVPPKNLGMTPQRIIALVLLLRCAIQASIRGKFKWRMIDTVAVIYFALVSLSMLMSLPKASLAINNRIGFFLSVMVPFWCVRFLIIDRQSFYALIKTWLWVSIPMAILGYYQMKTGYSPFFQIMRHGVVWKDKFMVDRRIFMGVEQFRAFAPFLQCIMFGWFFAIQFAPATNLFFQKRKLFPWIIPVFFLPMGCVSAIASGPMMMAAVSLALCACFPLRHYWKPVAWTVGLLWLGLMVGVNRSPMEIMAQFGMDPHSSWYRVKLQEFTLSLGGMKGHWLAGYGDVPDVYMAYHDLCIHWVWLLVVHGIMGFVGFYGLVAAASWSLWKGKQIARTLEDQWLLWSLLAMVAASLLGMLLTALFAEMYYIYHMLLAVVANADLIVARSAGPTMMKQVDVLVEEDGEPVILRYHLKPGQRLALVQPDEEPVGAQD